MSRGGHIETLIGEVAKRRILWDMRDKNYHNRYAVDEEWSQVAKAVDMSSNEAKAKWKSLRDSFRRELKKMPQREDENSSKTWHSKWAYFDSMLFLRDVMKFKEEPKTPRCSDTEENHTNDSDSKDRPLNGKDNPQRRLEAESQHSESDLTKNNHVGFIKRLFDDGCKSRYMTSPKKRRRHDRMDLLERVLVELETKKREHPDDEEDDDMNFFKSLLPYIRKLPPLKKLQIRSQYQSILINEIHEMENKSKVNSEAFSNFTYPSSSSASTSSSTTVSAANSDLDEAEHEEELPVNIKQDVSEPSEMNVEESEVLIEDIKQEAIFEEG